MTTATPSPRHAGTPHEVHDAKHAAITAALLERARCDEATVLARLEARAEGLSEAEAAARLIQYGPNQIARTKRRSKPLLLLDNVRNPLIILLLVLGLVSWLTGDLRSAIVVLVMVVLGVVLRFVQEMRADNAAARLQAMVSSTATVVRGGREQEIPLGGLVPGDVIRLGAGDMVPADVRLLTTKDLFLNQSALTGEAMPVEKRAGPAPAEHRLTARIAQRLLPGLQRRERRGDRGGGAHRRADLSSARSRRASGASGELTSFDKGVNGFTWLMIRFIGVMVPTVFLINGLSRGNWVEAFLFAVAVAVGLTPEMLPMIVTVNLSKGALAMAREKVIVKRLNSIQNLGAMDVLCTDKTGTLTEGRIVLERHVDVRGHESERVLHYGVPQQLPPHRPQEPDGRGDPRPRGAGGEARGEGEVPEDRRDPLRLRAPADVGDRGGCERDEHADLQGRGGGGPGTLRQGGHRRHDRATDGGGHRGGPGDRAWAQRPGLPGYRAGLQGHARRARTSRCTR